MTQGGTQNRAKTSRDANLSPDGKWRSFPKVPNLVQYVSTGTYFGRVKIEGKVFRESLETDVYPKLPFWTERAARHLFTIFYPTLRKDDWSNPSPEMAAKVSGHLLAMIAHAKAGTAIRFRRPTLSLGR